MAFQMYVQDNQDWIVPNMMGVNAGLISSSAFGDTSPRYSWAGGWLDYTQSPLNTNTAILVQHNPARRMYGGMLGTYLKEDARVFRCPDDTSTVTLLRKKLPRARSVSMNYLVDGSAKSIARGFSPEQQIAVNSGYSVYRRMADFNTLSPSQAWTIIDEHADSINDSVFFADVANRDEVTDWVGAYHRNGTSLAFADGHSEMHVWRTRAKSFGAAGIVQPTAQMTPSAISLSNPDVARDWKWLLDRTAVRPR
jgi:prepilin-type processing-associated H-X9-DG protein